MTKQKGDDIMTNDMFTFFFMVDSDFNVKYEISQFLLRTAYKVIAIDMNKLDKCIYRKNYTVEIKWCKAIKKKF
jgi:hypothetical protein